MIAALFCVLAIGLGIASVNFHARFESASGIGQNAARVRRIYSHASHWAGGLAFVCLMIGCGLIGK